MKTDNWHGAYRDGWQGEIVPEAFAHPAKYSRSLIRRIYQHAREEGWIPVGSTVLDPFGGVALGALDAMHLGLNWCGVELEGRFQSLGQQNIARWNARYSTLPGWGTATLVQGDSRRLTALVGEAVGCVSSPPYAGSLSHDAGGNHNETYENPSGGGDIPARCYGTDPDNLGNMRLGDVNAVISSPPFANQLPSHDNFVPPHDTGERLKVDYETAYGCSPGQLGAMPAGGFDSAISSPPYADAVNANGEGPGMVGNLAQRTRIYAGSVGERAALSRNQGYGESPDNLGNATEFWTAARTIVEQVYTVLRPGAHAIWVLKAYVRDKQIVDFPDQWRQMCEACGFETLHVHRAWLVEDHGGQHTLDGGVKRKRTERKSFFRRLAESKGSPRIDYEIVLCQVKPADTASQSGQASACVSSPPFSTMQVAAGDQLRDPAFHNRERTDRGKCNPDGMYGKGYGTDAANLGNMKPGDFDGVLKGLNSNGKGDTQ